MKIILATGGSGGHIFPALSVAKELKKNNHEVIFMGAFKKSEVNIEDEGFDLVSVDAVGFSTDSILKLFSSVYIMLKAVVKSYKYLKRAYPDVVAGFGGYGAFAPVFAAVSLRIPVLIHEQNVVPGKANHFLSHIVDKIAVSFKESMKFFDKEKTLLTGCPSHLDVSDKSKEDILKKFNLKENIPVILVLGGSQGSHTINTEFVNTAELLKKEIDFQIIHVTGHRDFPKIKNKYDSLNIPYYAVEFLKEIDQAYNVVDLVISRAGAVTVSEIISFNLPVIFIPYLFAGGHQKENAKVCAKSNTVKIVEEQELSASKLKNEIIELMEKRLYRKEEDKDILIRLREPNRHLAKEIEGIKIEE